MLRGSVLVEIMKTTNNNKKSDEGCEGAAATEGEEYCLRFSKCTCAGCKQSMELHLTKKMIIILAGGSPFKIFHLTYVSKCILCNPKLIAPTWSFVMFVSLITDAHLVANERS